MDKIEKSKKKKAKEEGVCYKCLRKKVWRAKLCIKCYKKQQIWQKNKYLKHR